MQLIKNFMFLKNVTRHRMDACDACPVGGNLVLAQNIGVFFGSGNSALSL